MTNWHDPVVQAAEGLAIVKLKHVFIGVYIWEFVLNLDYEYSVIMRKRKFNRSVPLYLGCRWSTLLSVISHLVGVDVSDEIDCEASLIMTSVSGYLAYVCAASLIILRIYALWGRKSIVIVAFFVVWLASTAAFVYNIAIIHVRWDGTVCDFDHIVDSRITVFTISTIDLVLLSLMLFGLWRWKAAHLTWSGGIWRVMYTQGLVYILVATLGYAPGVILLLLNLNEQMDLMFMVPSMVILSIGSLRMYRGLVDSAALKVPLEGFVGSTEPSTIRFARPDFREEDIPKTGGTVLEPRPTTSPQGLYLKRRDEESFGMDIAQYRGDSVPSC